MVAVSSAVAKDEGVKGDCCTRIAVVGDQVTVCAAKEVVAVLAVDPSVYPVRLVVIVATDIACHEIHW